MPDPLSITCPHCTASFKAKSAAALGKKVKCPKCDEPFVIQSPSHSKAKKPKKKSKKVKPKLDFLEDDSNSSTDVYEDDFDDWNDDLSDGPAVKPTAKKKHKAPPKKKKTQSRFSLRDYGLSPLITGLFLFLVLMNLVLFFMHSPLFMLSIILSFIMGAGCLFAGGIGLLIEAAKESGGELLLCLLIPFYNIYFAISRFDQTKHALATFGTGVTLLVISFFLVFGFFSNIIPRRNNFASTPPAVNTAPDSNQHLNSNPFVNRSNQPDRTSQPHTTDNKTTPSHVSSSSSTKTKRTQLSKFDLSQIKPMLMTWPAEGVSGLSVYSEKTTASIGTMFETSNSRSYEGETPAGGHMKFRVYLPPNLDPTSPVPCILIPPAGSNLLTGMGLDPSDSKPNPEHEPYIKAGFAVVTFSLDGPLWRREQASLLELKMAHKEFRKSKAGLVNCVHAFLETQSVIPGIDKNNIFIAGHSSAGTLSLLFAEHYPQIKGCLAYALSVDLKKSMAEFLPTIKPLIPNVEGFLRLSSPQTHVADLKCPVFLFHSRGDQVASFQHSYQFASQLTAQGTNVEFVAGKGSDHYQTMIDEGLPKGIEWIKKQLKKTNSAQPTPQMATASGTGKKEASQSSPQPAKSMIDLTRQKHIIRYGVYGGKTVKESAKRSLKGFVWVDQKSIQFNPDTKEISLINRSPVDQGALNRALTRNKFYQLNITQEAVPQTNLKPEKEATKADSN